MSPRCHHMKREEKESLLRIYATNLQDLREHKIPNPESKAVKNTAKLFGSSSSTLRKVLKEKRLFGNVKGAPYPRDTLNLFDKLTVSQKDALRSTVHSEIKKCNLKEEGAKYPTTRI